MSLDTNRLLLVLEKTLKDINREVINTEFEKLSINDVKPVLELVARSRVDYLKDLFEIATKYSDTLPPKDRIDSLKAHRIRYEELVAASQALETALERNYLDVLPS